MTPDQWRRVKDLLPVAMALDTAGQRALVEREFGTDPALREEVHDLLTNFTLATLRLPQALAVAGVPDAITAAFPPSGADGLRFEPGDMCGRYEVARLLGSGGMARVYLANDTELSTPVALKVLSDELLESSEARLRLRREAQNAAKLRGHPHIATFLDLIHVDVKGRQFPVIVMEYVEGRSCAQHLADHPIAIARVLRWASQIADAVEYAHDRGVLHCDLKPQNVQITPDDTVKVLDFGVARAVYGPSTAEIVSGTVPYMAPEQIAEKRFTEAGDVYGLGVMLFELIARQRPFAGERMDDVILQILGLPAPRVSAVTGGVPASLDALVERTLAKAPRRRPQSMRELRQELAGIQAALEPPPVTVGRRVFRWTMIVGTVLAILTFVGFVSSMAFDLSVGRTGRFTDESALSWPVWGARMLVAPLVRFVFVLLPVVLGILIVRRAPAWLGLSRYARWPFERLMRASTNQLAMAVLVASVVAVNLFFLRFQNAVAGLSELVSDSPSVNVAWLRPDNFDEHNSYRFLSFLMCAGMVSGWTVLARRRPALFHAPTSLLAVLGALVLAIALGLWALPYRLLWQAERERVRLDAEVCYVVSRQTPELLLFCPRGDPPRSRVVPASDPRLRDDSVIEKIFTPWNDAAR
jgi:hypothetical protein